MMTVGAVFAEMQQLLIPLEYRRMTHVRPAPPQVSSRGCHQHTASCLEFLQAYHKTRAALPDLVLPAFLPMSSRAVEGFQSPGFDHRGRRHHVVAL